MRTKGIGFLILGAIILLGLAWKMFLGESWGPPSPVKLKGLVGSEKLGFLEDEQVQKVLRTRYGCVLDYNKAGSIEMIREDPAKYDFFFPSSQVALEIYKSLGKPLVKDATIFNSPIVLYSWDIVAEALEKSAILQRQGGVLYAADMGRLVKLVLERAKWTDIGLPSLYGNIAIIPTDPLKSNSGNQFAGLVASILNGGELVDEQAVGKVLPQVNRLFGRVGYMEHSTGVLFEQFLRTGIGAHPIIVGYENQLIEFGLQNKDIWEVVKGKVRILYPVPTVWSSHIIIATNAKAASLIKALEDPEVQRIAWTRHGFRTGLAGVRNDPKVLTVAGIPERIEKVIPMPSPAVMERIIAALQTRSNP
ncbi:MAG: hypothetical protein HXY45_09480 [Syntrophaceae bacterium]|nr:hypothetical protein [Syntrophaceae bacterium]